MKSRFWVAIAMVVALMMAAAFTGGCYAQRGAGKAGVQLDCAEADAIDGDVGYYGDGYCYNTEEYSVVVEHGFVSVSNRPVSTFSTDIDTASYCNLRRLINEGYGIGSIPQGAVRVEEMLNYFKYSYAKPCAGELFGVTAQISDCPWNEKSKLMVVGLQASSEMKVSKGNNLVFLIDISGSMDDPCKLELLKESFAYLLSNLDGSDTVSIVTYANGERVWLSGAKASEKGKIMQVIAALRADGATNGQAGLAMAYEVARENFIEGGNNRIILASDGDLNVGISSSEELSDYVSEMRKSGIYLSVLGFGAGNYKDSKMERIADDGNGAYYYIDSIDEAKRVFGEDLNSTMVTIAEDAKLQIEFDPKYVSEYRQIGYENRELTQEEFNNDSVDAGEIGAGCCVTVAYEIVLTDEGKRMGKADWMNLSIRYKDAGESKSKLEKHAIGSSSFTDKPDENWQLAAAVIEFAMLANESEYAGGLSAGGFLGHVDMLRSGDERVAEFKKLAHKAVQQKSQAPEPDIYVCE